MITSEKIFTTLKEAREWGSMVAQGAGFKLVGIIVTSHPDGGLGYSPKWEY